MKNDLGALGARFRAALKAAAAKRAAPVPGMRLYRLALAVGRAGSGGFAPVGMAHAPVPEKHRAVSVAVGGEALVRQSRPGGQYVPGDSAGGRAPMSGMPESVRKIIETAKREAMQAQAKRVEERSAMRLPLPREETTMRVFAPVRRNEPVAMPRVRVEQAPLAAPAFVRPTSRPPVVGQPGRGPSALPFAASAAVERGGEAGEAQGEAFAAARTRPVGREETADLGQALRTYFFRQSRLPPSGSAGFDPRLTPLWAGIKIPG